MTMAWENVSAAVERLFGLQLQGERLPDLKRALQKAAHELGLADREACAKLLLSGNLDSKAMEVLANQLTIGETYFFRDEDVFAALSTRILPGLIAARRHAGDHRLRIWSAACCTGEEVHSVGILLRQLLPDIADWRITLLGTDVNAGFLRKAAEGVYGQWSFRGTPAEFRTRYFRRVDGGRYALLPAIRRMASFAVLNLADETAMAGMRNGAFDLILCRNVLMYFSPVQASKVTGVLHAALHQDGWLAVAPCEASPVLFDCFHPAHCAGTIFYRKHRPRARRPACETALAAPVPVPATADVAAARAIHAPPPVMFKSPPAQVREAPLPAQALAATARALADEQRMDEALTWCDRWIAAQKLDPAAHYLRGMILTETGDLPAACAAFERSLYIAPDGVMAGLALAGLERDRGRGSHAVRHYRNVLASLEQLPLEADVEYAEGVTVRQLTALVRDMLSLEQST